MRMRLKASGGGVATQPKQAYSKRDQLLLAPAIYTETRAHVDNCMAALREFERDAKEVPISPCLARVHERARCHSLHH